MTTSNIRILRVTRSALHGEGGGRQSYVDFEVQTDDVGLMNSGSSILVESV